MNKQTSLKQPPMVKSLNELSERVHYSLKEALQCDPQATEHGDDHNPRQIYSGHYVPVKPTAIPNPEYITHSNKLFNELGFDDCIAQQDDFIRLFSGDMSQVPENIHKMGWACGYALSIYGTEYYQQCPFKTGNGYGDGRAISIIEGVFNNKRWEMQLKGGGRTPYCRGADGRAVLRSSVREFLAQEHMHALGIPTSRSLSLYVSKSETVQRPWYSEGSHSHDPDRMILEPVAISTRVAPSFIRVGQLELFGRRARKQEHPNALQELEQIVLHLIDREYASEIEADLSIEEKALQLAIKFRDRLTSLVANWIRVGYCQGNFNSDNCPAGGFTLDYGPFGFCEAFDPLFQPWTGGGEHFSFFNQPVAAESNFHVFCVALLPLFNSNQPLVQQLSDIRTDFATIMQQKMETMWASKLGLSSFDTDLFNELLSLMKETPVDYTLFFRALAKIPQQVDSIKNTFYGQSTDLDSRWNDWLTNWNNIIKDQGDIKAISEQMKRVNPKYTLREWFLAPAYQQAKLGNYEPIRELQNVMTKPYDEQTEDIDNQYNQLKPSEHFGVAGLSFYSCSS